MPKKSDSRNIAESPAIADTSQSSSHPSRTIESFGEIHPPIDIVEQLSEVANDYVQRKVLFALGYIRRRELVRVLGNGSKVTIEIRNSLGQKLSASNVKGHLDVLVSTGLVSAQEPTYKLTPVGEKVSDFMQSADEMWLDVFSTEEGSAKRCKILNFLSIHKASKFDEIATASDINKSEVHRFLKSLVHAGLVEKGPARFDPYSLTDAGHLFLKRVEQLVRNLVALFIETIALGNVQGMSHLFLISPSKGFIMIEPEELVLSVRNGEFVRIE